MATLNAFDLQIGQRAITANLSSNGLGTYVWDTRLGDVLVTNNVVAPGNAGKSIWSQLGTKIYTGP